ncbi:alpha-ketoglutarate-dependent dioxygenase AlkB, partial [Sinorhizobium medicae]
MGHDDEKERIITWLSRKSFWTSSWLDVIHPRFSARTVCW